MKSLRCVSTKKENTAVCNDEGFVPPCKQKLKQPDMSVSQRGRLKALQRLLRETSTNAGKVGGHSLKANQLEDLLTQGLIVTSEQAVVVTDAGRAYVRRALSDPDGFQEQHRTYVETKIDEAKGRKAVHRRNATENVLLWLHSRMNKDGSRFISETELKAGERFASDYRLAQLVSGTFSRWAGDQNGGPARHHSGDHMTMTDKMVAARRRIDEVHQCLGRELGSVVVDVCCFDVGLADLEKKRNWPARSAKLVLKIALNRLAQHYGYEPLDH